ncbi:MAG TPA: MFS transporter, partial [Deinococcales bacterium]|nr:MFS transporter [Deinococcales bacterium]
MSEAVGNRAGSVGTGGNGDLEDALDPRVPFTMRLSVFEGGVWVMYNTWATGSILTGFLIWLGATPFQLGLVGSLGLIAQFVSPLAAWLAANRGNRKRLLLIVEAVSRLMWFVPLLMPFTGLRGNARVWAILAALALVQALHAAGGTVWQGLMGDLVPARGRGAYFGRRSGICNVTSIVAAFTGGFIADRLPSPLDFQVVLGLALVAAVVSWATFPFHFDPNPAPRPVRWTDNVAAPLRDAAFRKFLTFGAYWNVVLMISSPFVFPFFLHLKFSFTDLAYYSGAAALVGLFSYGWWGKVSDRVGNKAVLAMTTLLAGTVLPGLWVLTGLTNLPLLLIVAGALDGFAFGGVNTAIFNLTLVTTRPETRMSYLAVYGLVTGLFGFLAGSLSGVLLGGLTGVPGLGSNGPYYVLFALAVLGRSLAWLLLRRVPEAGA